MDQSFEYPCFYYDDVLSNIDVIDCGKLPTVQYGTLVANQTTAGSKAVVRCHRSYIVRGNNIYTCSLSGAWTGSATCGKL